MKILMVNNQLSVIGGSETYMFAVGDELSTRGHDVQYFGREDLSGKYGNIYNIYAKSSLNPLKQIKNKNNAKLFGEILDKYRPDVVHINLMYFVLTPVIVYEAKKRGIPIVQTVHDPKIVCCNHRLYITHKERPCKLCIEKGNGECLKNKCVKNSILLSLLAKKEADYYAKKETYREINKYIFPSEFMKNIHVGKYIDEQQAVVLHNFSRLENKKDKTQNKQGSKYVLYFGRISAEKGVRVLIDVMNNTPDINYIAAGTGPLEEEIKKVNNCQYVGFKSGEELERLISGASLTVFPSIWYENCPMSILESIALGTPVIGANIGGIPELIEEGSTGVVCKSGDIADLELKIKQLYNDDILLAKMSKNCKEAKQLSSVKEYVDALEKIYEEIMR